jgi:hypothetical protein
MNKIIMILKGTLFGVNERAKRATNERLNWATWENK